MKKSLEEKVNILIVIYNLNYSSVKFIKESIRTVIKAKRTLKNSYMFGYYMKDTQQKNLFENSLGILEYYTESLYKLLSDEKLNNIIESDSKYYELLEDYVGSVNSLNNIINRFRKSFIEEIENKYISDLDNELIDY